MNPEEKIEPEINVGLLRQVQAAIMKTPTQFNIDEWHIGDVLPGTADKCSSSACIAGWAVVLGPRVRLSLLTGTEIERLAREVLGLSAEQSRCLFLFTGWPWGLQERYICDPKTLEEYAANARVANERIEVFITTGC